jgi:protease-4
MLYKPQRRKSDGFGNAVLAFFRWFFIIAGVWTILIIFGIGMLIAYPPKHPGPAIHASSAILTYTFKGTLTETADNPSFGGPLLHGSPTFGEIIDNLNAAVKDPEVKGFVARLQDESLTPAQLQELRDTLLKFRDAHKPTYIYADDYGGASSAMGAYYLASSFSQVWLQPVGEVEMNGVAAEVPFIKDTLDKIGVEPEFSHKGKYKSFPETFTLNGMSPANREMTTGMVNDLADQLIAGIAADRHLKADDVKKLMDDAPYNAEESLRLGLVDKLGYYEQMLEEAKRKAGEEGAHINSGAELSGTRSLLDYDPKPVKTATKIALITGAGDIVASSSSGSDMAADKIAKAFEQARTDKSVAAVVLRIDSPGGSPEAAETIRHAIKETQQDKVRVLKNGQRVVVRPGKPVIISMSGYAASGGYWIASAGDKIVAEPATLTGSIGVFGGKFVLAGLWQKLGVHWDSISVGANAEMFSSNTHFTDKQLARFESLLDGIYQAFIERVAQGRHLTPQQVEAVAEGHVWTGRQAKDRGLVDELGGLDKAVALAKEAAKLNPAKDYQLKHFPAEENPIEALMKMVSGDDDSVSIQKLFHLTAADFLKALQAEAVAEPRMQVR